MYYSFYNGQADHAAAAGCSIFLHLFINIRPLLVSLGIMTDKEHRSDIYLVLSVLLLFITGAIIIYYIGWHTL